jgi:hypothetical protein
MRLAFRRDDAASKAREPSTRGRGVRYAAANLEMSDTHLTTIARLEERLSSLKERL